MKKLLIAAAIIAPLAGCEDPKSVEYFMQPENREERKETVLSCLTNGKAGEICDNAAIAEKRQTKIEYEAKQKARKKVREAVADAVRNGGS